MKSPAKSALALALPIASGGCATSATTDHAGHVRQRQADARRKYRGPRWPERGLRLDEDSYRGTADPKTNGLTRDQRFFLTFAADWRQQSAPTFQKVMLASDPHALRQFHAIASPSNMPAFSKAFGCKQGDAMWRDTAKKVSIW